jgi:hypothetical protein
LAARRDATVAWSERIGVTGLWKRTLLDSGFDTLNAGPYIFITAPSSGRPPIGSPGSVFCWAAYAATH